MIAFMVCYRADVRLDAEYYSSTHVPMLTDKLTPQGLKGAEVRKVLGTPVGSPAPYQLIATLYFDDAATLQRALASVEGQAVAADIANFYAGTPDMMVTEVVA